MGNKEDLLAAARTCIYERGFAATTARDIATEAGVSLAAIGYHFGSKDRLLTEAFTDETGRVIGDDLELRIRATAGQSPATAFPQVWEGIAELFERNREVLVASVENLVRVHRTPSEQARMGELSETGATELATSLAETHPDLDPAHAHALGGLYMILLNGLVMQWMSHPEGALPTGAELGAALSALTGENRPGYEKTPDQKN
ncbi:TetR/AcrR family transcriptional regulator [Nocardia carnea]|uniref:TetR/AcrR family transcriptional regulator n=1 Tax=Nocardia carnea TaxID=37328 RepID=A0ABW7TZ20_9NOCA|nr:TetR/AcrR family transcriptional regulator [Nocardia carnea]